MPLTGTGWDLGLRADADQRPKIFETLRGLSSRIIRADQIAGLVQRNLPCDEETIPDDVGVVIARRLRQASGKFLFVHASNCCRTTRPRLETFTTGTTGAALRVGTSRSNRPHSESLAAERSHRS